MNTIIQKKLGFFGYISRWLLFGWQLICAAVCIYITIITGDATVTGLNEAALVSDQAEAAGGAIGTLIGATLVAGTSYFVISAVWFIGTVTLGIFVLITPRKTIISGQNVLPIIFD